MAGSVPTWPGGQWGWEFPSSPPCGNWTHITYNCQSHCYLPQPLSQKVVLISLKKTLYDFSNTATLNQFFACRIVITRLLQLNIKARQEIPEFQIANSLLIHLIALDIDQSLNIFTLQQVCTIFPHAHRAAHQSQKRKALRT